MLDRLIAAVYDGAKDGKFRATHTMAEWLGCSIPDLYAVLEAMGNKKIEEEKPAEDVTATVTEETSVSETPVAPETKEDNSEQKTEQKKPAVKPDLALFQLRKGRAYDKPRAPRPPRTDAKPQQGPRPERKDRPQKKGGKPGRRPDDRGERKERVISAAAQTRGDSPFAALAALKAKGGDK